MIYMSAGIYLKKFNQKYKVLKEIGLITNNIEDELTYEMIQRPSEEQEVIANKRLIEMHFSDSTILDYYRKLLLD